MASQKDTLRFLFRTWDDDQLRDKKLELEAELQDRNVTSHSAAGVSESSERHTKLMTELRALLDVMSARGLIDAKPEPRRAYGCVAYNLNDR